MSKSINILDKEYVQWMKSLVERYRQSQIKAFEIRPQVEGELSASNSSQQLEDIFKSQAASQ